VPGGQRSLYPRKTQERIGEKSWYHIDKYVVPYAIALCNRTVL
jgi:hypothetical protein